MALAETYPPQDRRDEDQREDSDVVFGDDWVAPDSTVEKEMRETRARRSVLSLNRSPLTRKIITFNLVALNVLVAGVLWLNSSRDTLMAQQVNAMQREVELVADVFEARLRDVELPLDSSSRVYVQAAANGLKLRRGVDVLIYDTAGLLLAEGHGSIEPMHDLKGAEASPTFISDFLNSMWSRAAGLFNGFGGTPDFDRADHLRQMIEAEDLSQTRVAYQADNAGRTTFSAFSPILKNGTAEGVIAMTSSGLEIEAAVRSERERLLQMFVIATLVSIGLSIVLASTIANPISDLADAAEIGRDRNRRNVAPGRIRIPDLTARPDEIGRLSGALRGMVSALYDRIDGNEQFAADVAHEIKNPLASLRSAVGSLRTIRKQEHRDKLLEVIEHDVRRLDRLVSDISNASRLDSELVKEEEVEFDLMDMVKNICQFTGEDARAKGIEFITDLPEHPLHIHGLEPRLAQVFVNLITNAISFCEDGDAIRVWARKRGNRVLVVVEDTGPGIPEEALQKIFKRFYTSRPQHDFGNNSGLGLAISKQIVEAHGGVIWAENIRPTEADVTSEPLGARFVVGLPI